MNIETTEALWDEIKQEAAGIVLFEPGLRGLEEAMAALAAGSELSSTWLTTVESWLKQSTSIAALALRLNDLSERFHGLDEHGQARHICKAAHILSQMVLGAEHEQTILISGNLAKFEALTAAASNSKPALPKLRNFSGRKSK
ncbi:MAG: hypothetical protein JNN26_06485 [Candidatus Obscuribacter sp.]|nr:hypothetical protein [Candidatus Obscuribacter sp.]